MNLAHPLNCLTFNFQRTSRSLVRGFEAAISHTGLTAPQFTTLGLLSGFGALPVSQLADKLGTDRTTVSRNMDLMAAKGWVEVVDLPDQRIRAYALTEDGRARVNAALPAWTAYQAKLVAILGPTFSQDLLQAMAKL